MLNKCLRCAWHRAGWQGALSPSTASCSISFPKPCTQLKRMTFRHREGSPFGVGFEEPPSLLEPENKFIGRTSPFDASQGAVRRGTPNDSPYQSPGGSLSTQRDKRLGIHSLRKGLFAHLFAFLLFFFWLGAFRCSCFFFFPPTNDSIRSNVKSPCPSPSFPLPPQSNILRSKNQPRGQGACLKRYLAGYRGITSTAFLLWEKKRGADAPDMATSVPSPHADLVCPKGLLWRGMARFS